MNNDFILELIGRYILTGIILWGTLFVFLVARLAYKAMKSGDFVNFIDKFTDSGSSSGKELSAIRRIIRFAIWPYGLCEAVHIYIRHELQAIREFQK